MSNLKRMLIGDKTYPFRIDMNVLQYIQEEYGSINQFEWDLIGIRNKKDAEGMPVYGKDGKAVLELTEPSVKAIITVLPMAVNEGIIIEADEQNKPAEKVTEEFVIRNCTIPYDKLSKMLHEEFRRCFDTKK